MADIHHDPSHRNFQVHTVAGTLVGITLLVYVILMIGQAVGLYVL